MEEEVKCGTIALSIVWDQKLLLWTLPNLTDY
jgi:hypothetical protein